MLAPQAQALTQFVIQGKWCSPTLRYEFSPKRMRVHRLNDGVKANFVVLRYEFFDNTVKVIWRKHSGDETWTRFGNFDAEGRVMTQLPEAEFANMPRRQFRRCTH